MTLAAGLDGCQCWCSFLGGEMCAVVFIGHGKVGTGCNEFECLRDRDRFQTKTNDLILLRCGVVNLHAGKVFDVFEDVRHRGVV